MSEHFQTPQQLVQRFAEVQQISVEDAEKLIGGETADEILQNIKNFTVSKINAANKPVNRAARRARDKKLGRKKKNHLNTITNISEKLNYIDLIQKLRKLNEKNEGEIKENEEAKESNI